MCQFITLAKVGEIPEGRGKRFAANDRVVAIFFVDGNYYALDDECPHMGAPLSLGDVRNGMVVCDRHLWSFRLDDGTCPDASHLRAETFEVRLSGNEIQVRVPLPNESI